MATMGKGFVAVDRKTGMAVAEFHDYSMADKINVDKYEIVPILLYLQQLNAP